MSLEGSLSAAVTEDGVELQFTVENTGEDPVEVRFSDGQRFDMEAADGSWHWAQGMMFTQALGTDTWAPGESTTYEALWEAPPEGDHTVRAWLTGMGESCEAETTVSV